MPHATPPVIDGAGARRSMLALIAILLAGLIGILIVAPGGGGAVPQRAGSSETAASGPVADETYLWRAVAIGGGGFVTGLASDGDGRTRIVRADVHGAYRWLAAENRWAQMVTAAGMPAEARVQNGMNQGVYEIAVAPGDPSRVYMAIKGRVYRSDDAGASWVAPASAAPFPLAFDANGEFRLYGPFMAVSPHDADLLFFGTPEAGLWRSADGAATWGRVDSVPAARDLRPAEGVQSPGILVWFEGRGAERIFAASAGHGVYAATGGGAAFAPLRGGGRGPLTAAQVAIGPDGTLYVVDQEAQTAWLFRDGWIDLTVDGALPAARFAGVAASAGAVFVTDEGGRIWCSSDRGRRWSKPFRSVRAGDGEPPWLRLNDQSYFASGQIRFDPAEPGRLWVAAGTGPYVAEVGDGCPFRVVWQSRVRGIEELVTNDVIHRPGGVPLFAAWDFGIHRKPDLNAFSTTFGPKERLLIAAQQLDWSASDAGFVVTNASDTRTNCCSEDGDAVLAGFSLDGGASWRKFATLPQPPGTRADDPWRMAFGTIAVAADSIDNIVWAPAYNRSPFYTLDRGRSWKRVELAGETLPFTGSFERIHGARKTLAADRVRPGTFYLVHSGNGANAALAGLWRTADGGRRWTRVFEGEIAPESRYSPKLRAVIGQAGHLFYTSGIDYGADTRLRRSIDGGIRWTAIERVDHVDDIAFGKAAPGSAYPTIFLSGRVDGEYGIWRSIDEAGSWQRVAGFPIGRLDQVTVIEADKDRFGRVYVGYMGSGWLYGEPARCRVVSLRPGADRECRGVERR